ncbi:MAG: penicillin-binding protein [Myxococcota bacterium]
MARRNPTLPVRGREPRPDKPIVLPRIEPTIESVEQVRRRARHRIRAVGAVLGALLCVVGARGVMLCVYPESQTLTVAAGQRWDQVTIRPRRGEIVDRDGHRLAVSVATPNVVVDPSLVQASDVEALAARVAEVTGEPAEAIADAMRKPGRYQRLAVRVRPSVARAVEAIDHPALWVEREQRRYYPEGAVASQVLGFVDASSTGRQGLEASLDSWLRGESVIVQRRRDRHGLDVDDPTSTPVNRGMDVHLTLDRSIQRIAERALAGVVDRSAPVSATAVVVDVRTGDLLALANVPTYDPNHLGDDPAPRRNHAVQDAIEPGSVVKPLTVAAAMEAGVVRSTSLVDCEGGGYVIGRARIRDDHPHGVISVREILKYSSNIGAAKLALSTGAEPFLATMQRFGIGQRSGVHLPGERTGVLRGPTDIKPIELATTAFGQGVTMTPLQLTYAIAALGNDGVRMKPRLVSRVEDVHGVPEFVQPPTPAEQVVSAEVAHAVVDMMQAVTEPGGTAPRARIPGYRVAGKTGTAQKVENGRYGSGRIGSFVGLVPADAPRLAIVVSVDDPSKGSRYGGVVAAPAFAEIGAASLRHLGVPPDPALLDEVPAVAPRLAAAAPEPLVVPYDGDAWTLPDLRGRSLREVVASLGPTGVTLTHSGVGNVVSQIPSAGAVARAGTEVTVVLQ